MTGSLPKTEILAGFPLGVIAGEGELPKLVAGGARQAGRGVAIVGLRGYADPALREMADTFCWRGVVRLGSWIRALKRCGCREVVMVGKVRKGSSKLQRAVACERTGPVWFGAARRSGAGQRH